MSELRECPNCKTKRYMRTVVHKGGDFMCLRCGRYAKNIEEWNKKETEATEPSNHRPTESRLREEVEKTKRYRDIALQSYYAAITDYSESKEENVKLQERVMELEGEVHKAYLEGYTDGHCGGSLVFDIEEDWEKSDALKALTAGQEGGGMNNWVESLADESAFDQPCKYGNRVESHSVYCHSKNPKAPRKCRHTWYWGRDEKGEQDEDCPFFASNPDYKEKEAHNE